MSRDGLILDISVLERHVEGSHGRLNLDAVDSYLNVKATLKKRTDSRLYSPR